MEESSPSFLTPLTSSLWDGPLFQEPMVSSSPPGFGTCCSLRLNHPSPSPTCSHRLIPTSPCCLPFHMLSLHSQPLGPRPCPLTPGKMLDFPRTHYSPQSLLHTLKLLCDHSYFFFEWLSPLLDWSLHEGQERMHACSPGCCLLTNTDWLTNGFANNFGLCVPVLESTSAGMFSRVTELTFLCQGASSFS